MDSKTHPHPGVMVVDDHRAVREAIAQLLEDHGLAVLAKAGSPDEALELIALQRPDVVLVDLSLGDESGLALVADLKEMDIPAVVCSSHEDPEYVRRALGAGARAYVSKRDAAQALPRTINDVMNGWVVISPRAADSFTEEP